MYKAISSLSNECVKLVPSPEVCALGLHLLILAPVKSPCQTTTRSRACLYPTIIYSRFDNSSRPVDRCAAGAGQLADVPGGSACRGRSGDLYHRHAEDR